MTRLLDRTEAEDVAGLRQLEGERLDALQATYWQAAISGGLDACRAVLKVMERRARLFGLDMPAKVAVANISAGDFATEFVRLVHDIDPAGLAEAIAAMPGGVPTQHEQHCPRVITPPGPSAIPGMTTMMTTNRGRTSEFDRHPTS